MLHQLRNLTYIKAAAWFVTSLLVSCVNDLITKKLGNNLPSVEIVFFRFAFSALTLLPFMFKMGNQAFRTNYLSLHIARGTILFVAITLWCISLNIVPIVQATLISFTIPLFVIVMAAIFLNEKIGWQRSIATLIGFLGAMIVINPRHVSFNPMALLLVVASIFFASLDVLNKKFIAKESTLNMLFYSSMVTMLISIVPSMMVWKQPSLHELILLFILGCGANVILAAILKAFSLADASSLVPFRYCELIFSSVLGFLLFAEKPSAKIYIGAALIIPSTFILLYNESKAKSDD